MQGQELRFWRAFETAFAQQQGHLVPWVPVYLSIGIGMFFTRPYEPDVGILAFFALLAPSLGILAMALARREKMQALAPLLVAVALVLAGFALAGTRAQMQAEPVLGWRYYGPIEGRIVGIDRSASDAMRLTLDNVVLRNIPPEVTPSRVRVALHGGIGREPLPGQVLVLTGHLSPPSGPVEPGGFDFQRQAWFQRLGAVGYSRTPAVLIEHPQGQSSVFRARMALSNMVQEALPGEVGAFAAAIITGDRSGMGQQTLQDLRVSNLAHLLAISGLHMGLLAGVVFGGLRLAGAALPWVALNLPIKKIAAAVALLVSFGYLLLSGGNVATERAFVMVAVMLIAVMLDRRALSLRAVAVAATIVLTLRPESLLGPGFQMSFAATTALIAVFGMIRDTGLSLGPSWVRPVVTVIVSSLVAGLATAPIAAAHFNQIAHFGLIANLLSVPLMGIWVMPAAVLAICLIPVGLHHIALWAMGQGLGWILSVAHHVASWENARGTVPTPDWRVLPMMATGALILVLWQGRVRWAGLAPFALSFMLWSMSDRPAVLISDDGGLVGVATAEGRALSKAKGSGFVAQNWLENDGDPALQDAAAGRWPEVVQVAGVEMRHVTGKRAVAALSCTKGQWVVLNQTSVGPHDCTIIDPQTLKQTGALALYPQGDGIRIVSARSVSGDRLWNRRRGADQQVGGQ